MLISRRNFHQAKTLHVNFKSKGKVTSPATLRDDSNKSIRTSQSCADKVWNAMKNNPAQEAATTKPSFKGCNVGAAAPKNKSIIHIKIRGRSLDYTSWAELWGAGDTTQATKTNVKRL